MKKVHFCYDWENRGFVEPCGIKGMLLLLGMTVCRKKKGFPTLHAQGLDNST